MKNLPYLLLIGAVTLLFYACRKDNLQDMTKPSAFSNTSQSTQNADPLIFNIGGNSANERSNLPTNTVLGKKRVNPFTVEQMTAAYNALNDRDIEEIEATDWYVKFCPQSIEEATELYDTDLNLYDFPLEYEVLEMGDHYVDPRQSPGEFPCYYAIVKVGYPLPSYGKLIDPLHLSDYDSKLTEEAFKQTGNEYESRTLCEPDDPNWPECECDIFQIGSPQWQQCIDDLPGDPPPPGPNDDCLNSNPNRPSGHIRVQDTQKGMEGVRRVKVILKDTWFTEDEVWTDDNGCFKLNETYNNIVWMWVKWKNDRCKIRGVNNGSWNEPGDFLKTMKDYIGTINDAPYNNIEVNYYWNPNTVPHGSKSHMRWAASTVNNAVHEFHDYAAQDGISAPPDDLDFYLGKDSEEAFALLVNQIGPVNVANAVVSGVSQSNEVLENLTHFASFGTLLGIYSAVAVIVNFFPDVHIGLIGEETSDQLKDVTYHEVAHTAHYNQVGSSYWLTFITATIISPGWGAPGVPDAGVIAIGESWASHINHTYSERTYGLLHSNGGSTQAQLIQNSYINILEGLLLDSGHVPEGVYHDLIDDHVKPIIGSEHSTILNSGSDGSGQLPPALGITGYTNSSIFSQLDAGTTSPLILRNKLKNILPPGMTGAGIDALFLDYGY